MNVSDLRIGSVFSEMMHKVVKYCLMSCDTIIMIHGLRTIEAAMELFKIAQMYSYMCVQYVWL